EKAMETYLERFNARITLREAHRIDLPRLRATMIKKAKKNFEQLRQETLKPSKNIVRKWYQRIKGMPWDVTVMMLSWNRFDMTKQAIETLEEHVTIPYQLLVIDNHSEPDVKMALQAFSRDRKNMKLILLDRNLGCSAGRLFSLDHIHTPYVMFIDNDIEVFPGTIEHLLGRMNTDAGILAASTNIVFPSGFVHVCGGDYSENEGMLQYSLLGSGLAFNDPKIGESGLCRWVNGGATLYRTKVLRDYPFDALMKNYYEDLEWCYRLNQLGIGRFYRSVEALALHHYEEKVPDDTALPPEDAKKQSMKYIEAIAYFYKKSGMIIPNLFDFVPELISEENKLDTSIGAVFLDCVNKLGSVRMLDAWSRGDLEPLFSGAVRNCEEWQPSLQDVGHDAG
ncbi:MAG: glycosyltransferase, partial [Planctomycetota bacterium]